MYIHGTTGASADTHGVAPRMLFVCKQNNQRHTPLENHTYLHSVQHRCTHHTQHMHTYSVAVITHTHSVQQVAHITPNARIVCGTNSATHTRATHERDTRTPHANATRPAPPRPLARKPTACNGKCRRPPGGMACAVLCQRRGRQPLVYTHVVAVAVAVADWHWQPRWHWEWLPG